METNGVQPDSQQVGSNNVSHWSVLTRPQGWARSSLEVSLLPNFSPSRERSLLVYFFVVYFASLSVFCLRFLYKSGNVQRNFKLILAAVEFLSCTDKNSYIFVHVSLSFPCPGRRPTIPALLCFQRVRAYPGLLPHMLGVRKWGMAEFPLGYFFQI